VTQIARALKTTRNSVVKWIDKALEMGVMAGMKDTPHKPREAVITDDAKAWVIHLACSKPKDPGYAAELWTRSALAGHVRREAVAAGFPALAHAGKATANTAPDLPPVPANTPHSPAIMSMFGMGRGRFWLASIFSMDTSSPVSSSGIEALNSSDC
jgi:hypothetical protein